MTIRLMYIVYQLTKIEEIVKEMRDIILNPSRKYSDDLTIIARLNIHLEMIQNEYNNLYIKNSKCSHAINKSLKICDIFLKLTAMMQASKMINEKVEVDPKVEVELYDIEAYEYCHANATLVDIIQLWMPIEKPTDLYLTSCSSSSSCNQLKDLAVTDIEKFIEFYSLPLHKRLYRRLFL